MENSRKIKHHSNKKESLNVWSNKSEFAKDRLIHKHLWANSEYAEKKFQSMSNSSSLEISLQTVQTIHRNLKTLFFCFFCSCFCLLAFIVLFSFECAAGVKEYGETEKKRNWGARCESPKESMKKLNKKQNSTHYITTQLLQKHTLLTSYFTNNN